MLKKVFFDEINWEKEGVLYRGNTQHKLEEKLLYSFVNDAPHYSGNAIEDREKLTFVTPSLFSGFWYAEYWLNQQKNSMDIHTEFTFFPCVMAINVENYKNRIFTSTNGEGICLVGKIKPKDINLVFAKGIDRISKFFTDKTPVRFKELNDPTHIKNQLMTKIKEFDIPKMSFLEKYHNRKMSDEEICFILFGPSPSYSKEQVEKVRRAVKYLKAFYTRATK